MFHFCRTKHLLQQAGADGDETPGYIANMRNSATAGFKYSECKGIRRITVRTKGYATGRMVVRTAWDGEILGSIPIGYANVWHDTAADVTIPDELYFGDLKNGIAERIPKEY